MNIFYLDADPRKAARAHCDKHVRKMILEYAQLLSTAHHELQSPDAWRLYKATHINHPSAKWARHCRENYVWLFRCYNELCKIYTEATGKQHKTDRDLTTLLRFPPLKLNFATFQPRCMFEDYIPSISAVPQCMPDVYKMKYSAVVAYRTYYMHEKSAIAEFTYNPQPHWYHANETLHRPERSDWLTHVLPPVTTRPLQPKQNHVPIRRPKPTSYNKPATDGYTASGRVAKLKPAISSMDGLLGLFGNVAATTKET